MELIEKPAAWRSFLEERRRDGSRLGFVPTMGALHAGHLSLVAAARERADFVTLSIFVNPLQFGEDSDLALYPRDLAGDLALAEANGVGAVFAPGLAEMYPHGEPATKVEPGPLGALLEGASRPGHFSGVATVLTKLFSLAGACISFFGEKDFQQLAVVRQLVGDLDLPVEVVGCPVVREPDGLALSSRNRRLSARQRRAAPVLYRSLLAGREAAGAGAGRRGIEEAMGATLASEPLVRPDYAVAVDPLTLAPASEAAGGELRLLVAARIGPVRLIDNLAATGPA